MSPLHQIRGHLGRRSAPPLLRAQGDREGKRIGLLLPHSPGGGCGADCLHRPQVLRASAGRATLPLQQEPCDRSPTPRMAQLKTGPPIGGLAREGGLPLDPHDLHQENLRRAGARPSGYPGSHAPRLHLQQDRVLSFEEEKVERAILSI